MLDVFAFRFSPEFGNKLGAIFLDVTDRSRHAEQQELLLREMDHRVKNLFAITGGIVSLSARAAATPQEMATSVQGRLGALAAAHQLVRPQVGAKSTRATATLAAIVETVLRPFVTAGEAGGESCTTLTGPDVTVSGDAVTSMAMILHELATNAAKYGALSRPGGHVDIAWNIKRKRLALSWTERGGPPVKGPPEREGFGSLLAQRSIAGQLDGTMDHDWRKGGLTVHLSVAMERLTP
jgi:two-component system CheB/CheR fusion protein